MAVHVAVAPPDCGLQEALQARHLDGWAGVVVLGTGEPAVEAECAWDCGGHCRGAPRVGGGNHWSGPGTTDPASWTQLAVARDAALAPRARPHPIAPMSICTETLVDDLVVL
jgi:hypothetical protein